MGERDAFGREKDEDALAQMGWKPSAAVTPGDPPAAPGKPAVTAAATSAFNAGEAGAPFARRKPRPPEPEPAPQPAAPPREKPPAPTFTRPRRRGGPSLARLIFVIGFVGVLAIGVTSVVQVGGDAVDGIRDKIKSIEPDPAAPSPTAPGSLLRAAPLRDALAKLPSGKLVFIRISSGSVDAQVLRGGRLHTMHVQTNGPTVTAQTPAGAAQRGFKLDPAAPLRVARTASRRAGLSVNDVDYIVGTPLGWTLFFKDGGPQYQATLSGRKVTKV